MKINKIISNLKRSYRNSLKGPNIKELNNFQIFMEKNNMKGWECFFVPEDFFYDDVLKKVHPDDVIFDVGAGDLRFDLMLSEKVKKVYAIEINPTILSPALRIIGLDMPKNLIPICANAFEMELPSDVTLITSLMIHRSHDFPISWQNKRLLCGTHTGLIELFPYPNAHQDYPNTEWNKLL